MKDLNNSFYDSKETIEETKTDITFSKEELQEAVAETISNILLKYNKQLSDCIHDILNTMENISFDSNFAIKMLTVEPEIKKAYDTFKNNYEMEKRLEKLKEKNFSISS